MDYTHILFDLDGTLTESGIGIINCFQYALDKMGVQGYDPALLKGVIGPPLSYSFQTFFGMDEVQAQQATDYYRERYVPIGIYENALYDGVLHMLDDLHQAGCTLCLATSKPEAFAPKILDYFGILPYFTVIGAASMDDSRNTKEAVIDYVLSHLPTVPKDRILMVGDRHHDLDGAAAFGLAGAGVLYGYGSQEELAACPHVFLAPTPQDLTAFILK